MGVGLPIVLKVSKVLKGLSLEKFQDFLVKTFKTFKTLILPTFLLIRPINNTSERPILYFPTAKILLSLLCELSIG